MAKKNRSNAGSIRACVRAQIKEGKHFRAALSVCRGQRGKDNNAKKK